MKRKHRIWPWIITPCILLFLTAVAFHVIPRRHLHTYKEQLRAQGYPLTLQECQTTPHTPQAIAAASQFNDAAQQLGSLSQTLENIPSPMPMSHPGHALPGWLAPHLGYINTERTFLDANTQRILLQRYGISPSALSNLSSTPSTSPTSNPVYTAWSDLTAELQQAQAPLDTITTLSHQPAFDWNIPYSDGFSVSLPHLASLKNASQWLAAASLHDLHHQNRGSATQHLLTQLRLIQKLDHNNLLIGQLVRIAIASIAWGNTWSLLQADDWTDTQLQEIQTAWEQVDTIKPAIETFHLERATALVEYQKCRRSVSYTKELFDAFLSPPPDDPGNFIETAIQWLRVKVYNSSTLNLRYLWWIWFQSYKDELTYLQESQALIEALQLRHSLASQFPVPVNHLPPHTPWTPRAADDEIPEQYLFAANINTPLSGAIERAFRLQTQQQLALTAIAIQRYQLTHSNPPPSLTPLLPSFLKSPPLDWTAGHPLHYQTTPSNTFLLYACGSDETDDGGDSTPRQPRQARFYSPYTGRDFVWPQPALPPLRTPDDFAQGFRLPHKNSDPETFRLQAAPNQPPLWITATTTTPPQSLFPPDTTPDNALGFIHIATGYPPNPSQILPAFVWKSHQLYDIKVHFIATNLNDDAYPDLALLLPSTPPTPYSHAWLYNPTNQTFNPSLPPAIPLQ